MDDKITSISYSLYVNKGVFALLLGSGISRNAGIMTGWEITLDLIQQIATLQQERITDSPDEWYTRKFNEEPDYSNMLQKLTNTSEERINLLRKYIEPTGIEEQDGLKQPTKAHRQIAKLVQLGYIKVILTTNFDRLLENALKELGIEPTVLSNPNHIENSIPLIHSSITVIKINGDYLDTDFLNLKSELEKYDPRLENLMKDIFENFGLITCGWSAKWDLALYALLHASNKFRFSNFFTHLSEPEEELLQLSQFRKGHLVNITDGDIFFSELLENIQALERYNSQHPLVPKIALARLKKYVAKKNAIISLHELIHLITEECIDKITDEPFPHPEYSIMKQRMEAYLAHIKTLSLLLAEGVFWSKKSHHKIWITTIRRFGLIDKILNTKGYSAWDNMQYFPCLILRYIIGISSLEAGNFELLKAILECEMILEKTHPWRVIRADHLNKMGQRTQLSDIIYDYIRPFYSSIIPINEDFENVFDYYEYLCALVFYDQTKDNFIHIGRYPYQFIVRMEQNFTEKQEEHTFIKNGLIKNVNDFQIALEALKNKFSQMR